MPICNLDHIDFGILGLPAGEEIKFEKTGAIYVVSSGNGTPGNGGTIVVPADEVNPYLRSIRLATRELLGEGFDREADVFSFWTYRGAKLSELYAKARQAILKNDYKWRGGTFMNCELRIIDDGFKSKLAAQVEGQKVNSGVYKLHCLDDSETEIEQMSRCLGIDEEGVIYIGKAKELLSRVMDLRNSFFQKGNERAHICGRRYLNPAHEKFMSSFPVERLFVTLDFDENPERLEAEELYNYCRKFGETPPLNNKEQASLEQKSG